MLSNKQKRKKYQKIYLVILVNRPFPLKIMFCIIPWQYIVEFKFNTFLIADECS